MDRRTTRRLAAAAALIALFATTLPATAAEMSAQVVNGSPVPSGRHAAVVILQNTRTMEQCTGTLVTRRWVLTAAHCVPGRAGATFRVGVGNRLGGLDDIIQTRAYVRHPSYRDRGTRHDVALLRLGRDAPATPVSMAGPGDGGLYRPGTDARIVGWGLTNKLQPTARLLEGKTKLRSHRTCGSYFGGSYDKGLMTCAGGLRADNCMGDSGGPLLVERKIIGIVNFGDARCAAPPTAYAAVTKYRPWIDAKISPDVRVEPFTVLPSTVTYAATSAERTPVTLQGKLVRAVTKLPVAGKTVILEWRKPGTSIWAHTEPRTTNANGKVRFEHRPAFNTEYRLRHPGSTGMTNTMARTSAVKRVKVRIGVDVELDLTQDPVALTGAVKPAAADLPVALQRWDGAAWQPTGQTTQTVVGGTFSFPLTIGGKYRVRVAATEERVANVSGELNFLP